MLRELYSVPQMVITSAAFRIFHRDERRGGQNGRRQCAIYNFYSAHMTEIVTGVGLGHTTIHQILRGSADIGSLGFATLLNEYSLNDFRVRVIVIQSINYLYTLFALSLSFLNKNISVKQKIIILKKSKFS